MCLQLAVIVFPGKELKAMGFSPIAQSLMHDTTQLNKKILIHLQNIIIFIVGKNIIFFYKS